MKTRLTLLILIGIAAFAVPVSALQENSVTSQSSHDGQPSYDDLSLTELQALPTRGLDKQQRADLKAAIKKAKAAEKLAKKADRARKKAEAAARRAEEARQRAEQKRLKSDRRKIHDSYEKTLVTGPTSDGSYDAYGRWKSQWVFLGGTTNWMPLAGGDTNSEWFEIRVETAYSYNPPLCLAEYCEPAINTYDWNFYNRASVAGYGPLTLRPATRSIDGCTFSSCDMQEAFNVALPAQLVFDTIEKRGVIATTVTAMSGDTISINVTYTRLIGFIKKIHDVTGYYANEVAGDPLMAMEITP